MERQDFNSCGSWYRNILGYLVSVLQYLRQEFAAKSAEEYSRIHQNVKKSKLKATIIKFAYKAGEYLYHT
eukprot:874973-Pleurochrysis_carterae.AAC.3